MTFSDFIRARGFTVKSLADAAGVSARSLEQYSSGRYPIKNARAWFAVAVADALGVTVGELLETEMEETK